MCGITAILTSKNNIQTYIFSSLSMLLNRGYDSCGICFIKNNQLYNTKKASTNKLSALEYLINYNLEFNNINIAIAHTRWATHGEKNDINSHPHLCFQNKFSIIHNGIIENFAELKEFLRSKDIYMISDTDTEVIVNLISYYYRESQNIRDSINHAIALLKGTWALAILCVDSPKHIYVTRHGSPLLISENNDSLFIASEISGFLNNNSKNYMEIQENILVDAYLDNNKKIVLSHKFQTYTLDNNEFVYTPAPYNFWTLKEIFEQSDSIKRALHYGGRMTDGKIILGGLEPYKDKLKYIENLIIIGCGTSYFSGLVIEILLRKLNIFRSVTIVEGSEFDKFYLKNKCLYILVSQSGETRDVYKCISLIKNYNCINSHIMGITNVIDSQIARDTDFGVYLNAGKEFGVASTKCFTSQVIILILISLWFSNLKTLESNEYTSLYNDIEPFSQKTKYIIEDINIQVKAVVDKIINSDKNSLFILGKEYNKIIAYESALKIKELSYFHAEGYSIGALKHGPFALIEKNTPVIFLISSSDDINKINSNIQEVKSRKALVIIIGNHINADIKISEKNKLEFLWNAIAIQLVAYYLCIKTGKNPDFPRNLAKVVTVE
jgi:glucosamine--fructose-6-phosphate aminotransferase (isomerizing)